jgi:RimJ/RimL family protein N-acetyltransferase
MHRLPAIIGEGDLRLRRAQSADTGVLFALFNNREVVKWLARPSWPLVFDEVAAFIETVNKDPESPQYWVVERNGVVLGGISASIEPASDKQPAEGPHIGYWLGEPFWGQGVMTRAASLLCAAIFAASAEPAIYSGVFKGNEGSLRIQQKLGFKIVGGGEIFSTPLGRSMPHVSTRLMRSDFRPVP